MQAVGHLKVPIGTVTKNKKFNVTKDIRVLDWSANEDGIDERIGKSKLLMYTRQQAIHYSSYDRLLEYATVGCPADCGADWTEEYIISAIRHGPHSSTMKAPALKVLHIEVQEEITQGYARKISFGELRKHIPKNLKLSPVVMIPHKSRDYRTILDLSFKLKINNTTMTSVNEGTVQTAPEHAMRELGRVIERMISLMATSPTDSPTFLFSKLDIKDGF